LVTAERILIVLPFLFYAAAGLLYAIHFAQRGPATGQTASALLTAGAVAHTFVLGMHTVQAGYVPLAGQGPAVSVFIWLLALTYLYVELTTSERAMGLFIAPLVALLYIVPLTSPVLPERPAVLESPLFALHVASVLCAYAAFALASVVSITYVLLFRELKRKQPGVFFARLPSLRALDQMNLRAVVVGLVFLTIGVGVGVLWVSQARGYAGEDPRVQAMSLADPKIVVALVSWSVYAFQLYARRVIGWGGHRTAWLSTIGFATILVNLLPVAYFMRTSHAFD
jgi:ABC-type transport system involved in cytochrome c biogenesis permease subunit